jgi:hypothetical protein
MDAACPKTGWDKCGITQTKRAPTKMKPISTVRFMDSLLYEIDDSKKPIQSVTCLLRKLPPSFRTPITSELNIHVISLEGKNADP